MCASVSTAKGATVHEAMVDDDLPQRLGSGLAIRTLRRATRMVCGLLVLGPSLVIATIMLLASSVLALRSAMRRQPDPTAAYAEVRHTAHADRAIV